MRLTCKKCKTAIEIPREATQSPEARFECPGCSTRYRLRPRATEAPNPSRANPRRAASAPPAADAPTTVSRKLGGLPPIAPTTGLPSGGRPLDPDPTFRLGKPADREPPSPSKGTRPGAGLGPATVFEPGDVLAGRYRIVRFLAQGGMGEVYEAEDQELRQQVALKTISAHTADGAATDRFKREIALARVVTHPNVCRIFDLGQHLLDPELPDGPRVTFLTMELLRGETVASRLQRSHRLQPVEALPIVRQMAAALDAAHQAQIVHRDFKSENVFLVPGETGVRAVVTDFGVARGAGATDRFASQVTGTGIVGTPAYMAPEQVEGGPVTAAADIYALGVVIYEMVTGRLPFESENPLTTAVKRLREPPTPPHVHVPDLPPVWERTILRCLERRPERRFAAAGEVFRTLAGIPMPTSAGAPAAGAPAAGTPVPESDPALSAITPSGVAPAAAARVTRTPPADDEAAAAWRSTLTPPVSPAAAGERRRLRVLTAVLLAVAVLSAGLLLWNRLTGERDRRTPRRSVAVLGFRNLTGNPEAAWLETALAEMLTTELARGGALRAIPGENVARIQRELGFASGTLDEEQRRRVRSLLGCDFLVHGAFTRVQAAGQGEIRLDLRLQDAALGSDLASLAETGGEEEIFDLVARLGRALRSELGVGRSGDRDDPSAGLPTDAQAARLYSEALEKLRASEPHAARELLQRAAASEPGNPLIHSALSSAWEAEGYRKRAAEAAERAFELSSHLSREDRLAVEGRYLEARGDYAAAAEVYRELHRFFPDDLEYGLRLAAVENKARRPLEALAAVEELKLLPAPISDDPRIDLAEAAAAALLSEFERQLEAARRAAERAELLGASLLTAQAKLAQSQAHRFLGQPQEAEDAAAAARDIYVRIEHPAGAALARATLANALVDRGQFAAAAAAYREAIDGYRRIGDRGGAASGLNNLALALRKRGELDRAQELYEEAEGIYRDLDDRLGVANTLNNLGVLLVGRDRLAEAGERFEQARAVWEEIGDPSSLAYSLNNVAAVLRLTGRLWDSRTMHQRALEIRRGIGQKLSEVTSLTNLGGVLTDLGELETAGALLSEAVELAREIGERSAEADALYGLGTLRLAQGELGAARTAHEEALQIRSELEAKREVTESRIALARVALAEGQASTAEIISQNAAQVCRREARRSDEAVARTLLATAYERQGRLQPARREVDGAVALAEGSERAAVSLEVALAAARLDALGGRPAAALRQLEDIERRAEEMGYVGLRLEAMLVWAEARKAAGGPEAAREKLGTVKAEAAVRGYRLLADEADLTLLAIDG